MDEQAKRPEREFRAGNVTAAIWANEIEQGGEAAVRPPCASGSGTVIEMVSGGIPTATSPETCPTSSWWPPRRLSTACSKNAAMRPAAARAKTRARESSDLAGKNWSPVRVSM